MPGLPLDAPAAVEKTYAGLALALECRWKLSAGEPIPFSRSFALPWCGLRDTTEARFAIEWLIERKIIAKVGELPSKSSARRPTALPSDVPLRSFCRDIWLQIELRAVSDCGPSSCALAWKEEGSASVLKP